MKKCFFYFNSLAFCISTNGFAPPKPPIYKKPITTQISTHKAKSTSNTVEHINLILLFEEGGPNSYIYEFAVGKKSRDAIVNMFCNGIIVNQPMIISINILLSCMHATSNRNPDLQFETDRINLVIKLLQVGWKLFTSPESPNYCVLLPQKGNFRKKSLLDWGFNPEILKEIVISSDYKLLNIINNNQLISSDISTLFTFNPSSIDLLNQLFDPFSTIRRRFLLVGHGTTEAIQGNPSVVAQMDDATYRKFLYYLNYLNTDFLLVMSCFSGGYNLEKFHKELSDETKKVFSLLSLNYILGIGATSDTETRITNDPNNLEQFFKKIDSYFNKPNIPDLKDALNIISINSIASIRFPGSNSFFRAIELDKNIKSITTTGLKIHAMNFMKHGKIPAPLVYNNIKELLVYAGYVNLPLLFQNPSDLMNITSMINGFALHIFKEIHYEGNIHNFFLSLFAPETSISKVFFIKKLIGNDGVFENILFVNQDTFICKIIDFTSKDQIKSLQNQYVLGNLQFIKTNDVKELKLIHDPKIALDFMWNYINTSLPSELSLYEATGGQETREMLINTLKHLLDESIKIAINKYGRHPNQRIAGLRNSHTQVNCSRKKIA